MENHTTSNTGPEAARPTGPPDLASLVESVLGDDPMAAMSRLLGGGLGAGTAATYEGVAGGGVVRIKLTGDRKMTAITISPEVLDGGDAGMLEEMILAAFNDAFAQASASKSELLGGLAQLLGPR